MELAKLHLHWGACRRGKKEYKSYSLARAYREGGKNYKEIILKLGKLSDSEVAQWRRALESAKNPLGDISANNIVITSNRAYLDVAVALEAWNSWDLNPIFEAIDKETKRDVPISSLATLLTINRCVDPASKSRVPAWAKKTILPAALNIQISEINPSRIFRELACIEACKDQIAQHLCRKMLQDSPEAMKSLFYDLSSTTFTGSRCMLVKWGHCKEGYENHIVLALIVNAKGLPIYWEVLEGGTADATTILWLLDRLKNKLSSSIPIPTMVFDRGMVSDDNLDLLEKAGVKYISAMDKNQIEAIASIEFSRFKQMTIKDVESQIQKFSDFIKLDKITYSKEIAVLNGRRYVLCFNPQLFKDQRKAREEQEIQFKSFVENVNNELRGAKKDREKKAVKEKFESKLRKAKLQGFVDISLEEIWVKKQTKKMLRAIRSYQGSMRIDEEKKLEVGKLDGFWMLVTNLSEKEEGNFTQETKAVVQPYREKVVIESSFRDIKSFIEISPVHVWKPEHVKAHYTICVLAYLIDRTLTLALHEKKGDKSKDIIAHERLYEELEGCRLNQIKIADTDQCFYKFTEQTERQKELLERLQMSYLGTEAALKNLSIRVPVVQSK
jgi:transposase